MSENIVTLYDDKIATPLQAVITDTQQLLSNVAALTQAQKQQITDITAQEVVFDRVAEAFLPSNTLAALPALFKHMEGLQGFFDVLKGKKAGPLAPMEIAAATQRWESFDQFAQAIAIVRPAIAKIYGEDSDVATRADNITKNCNLLYDALGGRPRDKLFLNAVEKIRTGAEPSSDQATGIYDAHIKAPMDTALAAFAVLQEHLGRLPQESKQKINALTGEYWRQCESNKPEPENVLDQVAAASADVKSLQSAMHKMDARPASEPLSLAEEQAAADPAKVFGNLRTPVRALHEILAATNSGQYDELLQYTATVAAQSWEVRKAMDGPLAAEFPKAVAAYKASLPSADITEAIGQPVQTELPEHQK